MARNQLSHLKIIIVIAIAANVDAFEDNTATQDKKTAHNKGIAALKGDWELISIQSNKEPQIEFRNKIVWRIDDKKYTIDYERGLDMVHEFSIDPSKEPCEWNDYLTNEGAREPRAEKYIYTLDGDSLKVCSPGLGKKRPSSFEPTKENGYTLKEFRRMKEKK